MVGTDFQSLVSAHHQSGLEVLLVLKQPDIACSTLLPFPGVSVEFKQLGAHLEGLFLGLLVCLGLDFLGQVHDRLKVNVSGLLCLVLWQARCQYT